jgi:hypothetical protein
MKNESMMVNFRKRHNIDERGELSKMYGRVEQS